MTDKTLEEVSLEAFTEMFGDPEHPNGEWTASWKMCERFLSRMKPEIEQRERERLAILSAGRILDVDRYKTISGVLTGDEILAGKLDG